MTKQNNKETPKKSKSNINLYGLLDLVVALAELASTYVFVTQDNRILLPLAVVLGLDCAQRFTRKFIK